MPSAQINVTLGTAGHIDHGKTALVKCLTGCDTDRLKAEKERGISIDLGFAPCTIANIEVGIVDVPGHENFIKTMVAGASGMDAVLLVVAADDGVMPQTREHLDILTLLGVQHGMVALTKVDRVDAELRELARADVEEYLRGTFLEGAPLLPVSSVTGEGFDRFYEVLARLMDQVRPKPTEGVFRLPLDRSFSVKGHGTVVAGIPVSGLAHVDDEVELLPHGITGRIRGIEVYGRASDTVKAGQCAAINVRHFDHHRIRRGDSLTVPGYFATQKWFVCALRLLRHERVVLKNGAQVRFHTGTAEVSAAIYGLKDNRLCSGDEQIVQIRAATPVVAGPGDRFILRTLSPVRTVGGGMIVEGVPGRLRRNRPGTYDDLQQRAQAVGDDSRFIEYCLKTDRALAANRTDLAVRTKLPRDRVEELLANLAHDKKAIAVGPKHFIHCDTASEIGQRVWQEIAESHRQSPDSPGVTLEELREKLKLEKKVLEIVIQVLKKEERIVEAKGRVATSEHRAAFREEDVRDIETIESLFRGQAFCPPGSDELCQETGADVETIQRILKILREHEKLVQVAPGMLFHRESVDRAREILQQYIGQEGKLESVRFKYLLDTTRKYALPLLDYFDRVGVTRRVGNTRYLKAPPAGKSDR